MRKILLMIVMILGCIVAKGQEYEIVKDTLFKDSGWPEEICFVKKDTTNKIDKNGLYINLNNDSLIITLLEKHYLPVVFRDVYSENFYDLSNIENKGNVYNEIYIYDYYKTNNNVYFLYKIRKHELMYIENINNVLETKIIDNSPIKNVYLSTEINKQINIERQSCLDNINSIQGLIMFIYKD